MKEYAKVSKTKGLKARRKSAMIRTSHILIGAGAVTAAYFGGSYLLKLNRLSNELESETKVSIHSVSLGGIELSIKVEARESERWKHRDK